MFDFSTSGHTHFCTWMTSCSSGGWTQFGFSLHEVCYIYDSDRIWLLHLTISNGRRMWQISLSSTLPTSDFIDNYINYDFLFLFSPVSFVTKWNVGLSPLLTFNLALPWDQNVSQKLVYNQIPAKQMTFPSASDVLFECFRLICKYYNIMLECWLEQIAQNTSRSLQWLTELQTCGLGKWIL